MRMQVDFIIAFFKVGQVPATTAEFYEHNNAFHKPLVIYIHPFLGIELGGKYQKVLPMREKVELEPIVVRFRYSLCLWYQVSKQS